MILDTMSNSAAWLSLPGVAVKLLVHLIKLSKGNNGYGDAKRDRGRLYLSEREAARAIGVAKNTAANAFAQLVDRGFLRVVAKGHYDVKGIATTWRLTFQPYPHRGMAPTNEWRKWQPAEQKPQAQNLPGIGSTNEPSGSSRGKPGSKTESISANSPDLIGSKIGPHIYLPWGHSDAPRKGRESAIGTRPPPALRYPSHLENCEAPSGFGEPFPETTTRAR